MIIRDTAQHSTPFSALNLLRINSKRHKNCVLQHRVGYTIKGITLCCISMYAPTFLPPCHYFVSTWRLQLWNTKILEFLKDLVH